jgi:hypothetical protein
MPSAPAFSACFAKSIAWSAVEIERFSDVEVDAEPVAALLHLKLDDPAEEVEIHLVIGREGRDRALDQPVRDLLHGALRGHCDSSFLFLLVARGRGFIASSEGRGDELAPTLC